MSDKFCGLCVTFEKEISKEYLETVTKLIKAIKGVANVKANISDINHHIAYEQARYDLRSKILKLVIND